MVKKIFNKKIVIVVDHKNRDLNGSIHLGALLYQRYFNNIYLVCNTKKYEIFLIKPDGVILPNASDKKFVKLCKRLKIDVFINDTEGARIGIFGDDYLYDIKRIRKQLNTVDLYFTWGNLITKKLKKIIKNKNKKKIFAVGPPRFDLITNKWIKPKYLKRKNKKIVLMTTFPIPNPRFNTIEKEKYSAVKYFYKSKKKFNVKFNIYNNLFKNFLEFIEKIINDFPNEKFLIRVHPFESFKIYEKLFSKFKNIEIDYSKNIINIILESRYILLYKCQTAVEAYVAKKKTLSLNFLDKNKTRVSPKSLLCYSKEVNSMEELYKIIKQRKKIIIKKNKYLKKSINDFFLKFDSYSSVRVRKLIKQYYFKKEQIVKISRFTYINEIIQNYFSIRGTLKLLSFKIFSIRGFFYIKKFFFGVPDKVHEKENVDLFLKKYKQSNNFKIEYVNDKDYYLNYFKKGTSLKFTNRIKPC